MDIILHEATVGCVRVCVGGSCLFFIVNIFWKLQSRENNNDLSSWSNRVFPFVVWLCSFALSTDLWFVTQSLHPERNQGSPFSIHVYICKHSKSLQLCPTLCHPMDCSPPGSSVHGILQARLLEWVALLFSRGASRPRDWTWVSCIAGEFFTTTAISMFGKVENLIWLQRTPDKLELHGPENSTLQKKKSPGSLPPPDRERLGNTEGALILG